MDRRALLWVSSRERGAIVTGTALSVLESGTVLAVPWVAAKIAVHLWSGARGAAAPAILVLLALFALQAALQFGSYFLLSRAHEAIVDTLRVRIYDHLHALPLAFHQRRRSGALLSLLAYDAKAVGSYVTGTLPGLVPLSLTLLGALVMMLRIDVRVGLVVMVLVPLGYLAFKVIGRKIRPLGREIQDAQGSTLALVDENLAMLPAIKAFAREAHEAARFAEQVARERRANAAARKINAGLAPAFQLAGAVGIVVVLWLLRDSGAARSPGETVSFLLYAALLTRPVSALADFYGQTQYARGAFDRIDELLAEPAEPSPATSLPPLRGRVELRGVHFAYPDRPPTLVGLDLHVRPGEIVALTGENGAGKSTLVHLLLRLFVPTRGTVLLDGTDIATVSLRSLRTQIGLVAQNILLFDGTVRENIAYGRADATDEAIERAARAGQAHEFIARLPQGYDTLVGERGVALSGGQRQRLALARALLLDPPILLLDEPTAQLDPEGEASFVQECRDAFAGRTVLLITHRPASLAIADRVLRLEGGRIVEVHEPASRTSRVAS